MQDITLNLKAFTNEVWGRQILTMCLLLMCGEPPAYQQAGKVKN